MIVSDRERRNLIEQGDHIFLEVQERLYDAKKRRPTDYKNKRVTTLDTFTVFGSLDEVINLFLHAEKKMVLDFSESRDLVVLTPYKPQRPRNRTSMRWSLNYSPSRLLAKDQDFCYLEIMKPYGTEFGRRGWARASHSIQHRACPKPLPGVIRAELFYCGLFFEETDEVGVLNATVYYSVKTSTTPFVLMPMVQRARAKRTVELVNHYLKMSNMIFKSKKNSLTRALQLQGEKRCTACANPLSMWQLRCSCVMCGSYMCDKCSDLVVRNYRVNGVERGQVACFSCSYRRGTRLTQEIESSADSSHTQMFNHMDMREVQKKNKPSPKRFDEAGELVHEAAPNKVDRQEGRPKWLFPHSGQRRQGPKQTLYSSKFVPQQTISWPTGHAEVPRRRCNTRATSQPPARAVNKNVGGRHRSRTTGNSKLSSRAKPTSCAPRKKRPNKPYGTTQEPVDVARVDEEMNRRVRRHATNASSVQPMEVFELRVATASRCDALEGMPSRSFSVFDVSLARYSKQYCI